MVASLNVSADESHPYRSSDTTPSLTTIQPTPENFSDPRADTTLTLPNSVATKTTTTNSGPAKKTSTTRSPKVPRDLDDPTMSTMAPSSDTERPSKVDAHEKTSKKSRSKVSNSHNKTETNNSESGPMKSPGLLLDHMMPTLAPSLHLGSLPNAVTSETSTTNHNPVIKEDEPSAVGIKSDDTKVSSMNDPSIGGNTRISSQELAAPAVATTIGVPANDKVPESLQGQIEWLRSWLQIGDERTQSRTQENSMADDSGSCKEEQIFSGRLMDPEGFFFPSNAGCSSNVAGHSQNNHQQQHERLGSHDQRENTRTNDGMSIDWFIDTYKHEKDAAALGEYYRGKGTALLEYYTQFSLTVRIQFEDFLSFVVCVYTR
jgi:hypothetical protein